jgi:hypothetical protein
MWQAEARLKFEERKTTTITIQFFPFLKCVYIFGTLCVCVCIHTYTYMLESPWIIPRMRNVSFKSCIKIKTRILCSTSFSRKSRLYEIMWKYTELDTPRMKIRRMCISCWIAKKNTRNMRYLLLFHCNNAYANAPQRCFDTYIVLLHPIWAKVRTFRVTSPQYYTKFWVTIVFWYVTPCSMVHRYQCFWESHFLSTKLYDII